jgi:DNA-binding FrmR family transcriptional regulator
MARRLKPTSLPVVGHPETSALNLGPSDRKDIDTRLARIEGHVKAIRSMLAAGEDCDALVIQGSAVKAAMNGVLEKLIEAHLNCCVVPAVQAGDAGEAVARFRNALATVLRRS